MFDPRPLYCISLTTAVGGTTDTNFVDSAHPTVARINKQFTKFMDVFKKLHINIPFADALEQMPSYVKFMKDILSQKRRLADFETVNLTEECSAILQRKLPQKL